MMAEAARYNIDRGAQIIDINMGCPAKKVCNKWAGSALMRDEPLALDIVEAVVAACAPQRRAGDAEDAHRLVRRRAQRAAHRTRRAGRRRRHGGGARPHARAGLQGPGRIRHRGRRQGRAAHSGGGQRRHRFAAEGAAGAAAHRLRRADDRPRRAGPAVDLPRDRALPAARRAGCRRRPRARCGSGCSSTCRTTTRCTANTSACAPRASTSAGRCARCPAARPSARR